MWTDNSPHNSDHVLANGVALNYLDWGGEGLPLVMIHGLAGSPHIFDDIAPRLGDRCRGIAYARRGHGRSDAPDGPYDLGTYVEDLRQLLDALDVPRASLLGWSMGGNEITRFAELYPERVAKLIYLEAGYDWSDPTFLKPFGEMIAALGPDDAALESLDSLRSWFQGAWLGECPWTSALEAFLRDAVQVDVNGEIQPVPDAKTFEALFASLAEPSRDYVKVCAPALALFATEFFPPQPGNPTLNKQVLQFEEQVAAPFRQASRERISQELAGVEVRQIPMRNHMSIGVEDLETLAAIICGFLQAKSTSGNSDRKPCDTMND